MSAVAVGIYALAFAIAQTRCTGAFAVDTVFAADASSPTLSAVFVIVCGINTQAITFFLSLRARGGAFTRNTELTAFTGFFTGSAVSAVAVGIYT
jgi:hypothetical protein